jgi:hypothetical protein
MKSTFAALLLVTMSFTLPRQSVAQSIGGLRAGLTATAQLPDRSTSQPIRVAQEQSQWKSGMIIGGVLGALIGYVGAKGFRNLDDRTNNSVPTVSTLIGLFVGASIGGMVGSGMHRGQ